MIIYAFFRDWIIAIRPLIDIPVSLIGAFFIMYLMGFTINVLSLLAIVLATGLVVDDGIVVTENIYKKIERGMNKYQAALEGSKEIYFAVIATSITLAWYFCASSCRVLPEGCSVNSESWPVPFGFSLCIWADTCFERKAFPQRCTQTSWLYNKTEPFFRWMKTATNQLKRFMRIRWIAIVLIIASLASGF
jgi:multidrug efflux pump